MSLAADIAELRQHLQALAADVEEDLIRRYALRRHPMPRGWYWRLRWLAAQALRALEWAGVRRRDPWPAALRHAAAGARARPLVIWGVGMERDRLRAACRGLQTLNGALPHYAPVLITDVADFAFFSRLGWLVEYLPKLSGEGDAYDERKARYLAWLYRGAPALPASAGLAIGTEEMRDVRRWLIDPD